MPEPLDVKKDEQPVPVAVTRGSLPQRLLRWFDKQTGVHEIMKESLDEPIPGGARLAYVFGSGLLFIFISQIITGLCLALYYVPSAETAHTSVAYITKQVAAGAFLRSLHYYGSSAMIVVLALHFLQTFLYGSFKGRRELLWISGAVLSFLVLGMGFTGYLLPWDQKAYFATAVGTNIVAEIPLIGNWLSRLLRGGDTIGTLTLSRFYVAHVFLIPAGILLLVGAHIVLFRKAGPAGPIAEDPVTPKMAPEGFYPRQVLMDMGFALLIMVGLGILAYFHPVGLGPIADPANTQFLPRPEWYYLSMFEWLKYWEGPKVVFAVIVIPGILALLFFLVPFLDRGLERRPWRRPIPVLSVAIVLVGIVYLGMKSNSDDRRDPTAAAQLAAQEQQEKAYSAAPFEPYIESPGGTAPATVASVPTDPLVGHGRGIFEAHGCAGCHGAAGVGSIAPALVGITSKLPGDQLTTLLKHPNARMTAGRMPAVDISQTDMSSLVAYMAALGTPAANAPVSHDADAAEVASARSHGSLRNASATLPSSSAAHAGQQTFGQHGCAACHGPTGEGGRAPAIAPLIARRSDAQLLEVFKAPNAKMKAGGMQAVAGTPAELTSLVAYLRTVRGALPAKQNEVADTSLSPNPGAAPAVALTATQSSAVASAVSPPSIDSSPGRAVFISQGCAACHGSNGGGTRFAPTLIAASIKFPGDVLPNLLHHPDAKMRSGGMPPVTANAAEMKQLVSYISGLGAPAPPPATAPVTSGQRAASVTSPATIGASAPPLHAAVPTPLSPLALRGGQVFEHYSCQTCHGAGGLNGTAAAPGLAGTASILPASTLENLLRHHSTQMKNGNMPPTNMNASDMKALIAFVRSMPPIDGSK
ncbi:MAG: Cytochrome b/b6 domain protein [Acidobacteriaceae bacterium]|nr:Cytochrome b/b6 domain protein [Acidobacteriaceae bacterium]